ncbi:MAG: CHASE domain-containing protein [Acidobacteria bacterium]|nr:CHASE domain-containing protein [Acidobacteriota bacterium]
MAVLALGLLASFLGYRQARGAQAARDQARLARHAARLKGSLEERLHQFGDLLRAGRGLRMVTDRVGAREWEAFVGQMDLEEHSDLKSLARIVRLPRAELGEFLKRGLAEGILYQVRPVRSETLIPGDPPISPGLPDLLVIQYAAPASANPLALGLDVGSHAVQREAAELSRDTGNLKLTAPLMFGDAGPDPHALALFLPLYKGGATPATLEDRRGLSDGWLSLGIRSTALIEGGIQGEGSTIAVDVLDVTGGNARPVRVDPRLRDLPPGFTSPSLDQTFDLGGRTWRASYRALPPFMNDPGRRSGRDWLVGGGLISLALGVLTWSLLGARSRALGMAHRLTEDIRAGLQRFHNLVENLPFAVIDWDTELRIQGWNPAAKKIFGYDEGEILGKHGRDLLFDDFSSQPIRHALNRLSLGRSHLATLENRTKDGGRVLCQWTNTPLTDGEGRVLGVMSLVEDVTQARKEEENLRRAQKLESLGVLAGGIAHDFNNLLAVVSGNADLAARLTPTDSPVHEHLSRILGASRRAADLAQQMLAYAGRAPMTMRTLDLNREAEEIADLLRDSLPKLVEIQLDLDVRPAWVRGDPAQMQQVLMNLVTNGAEAIGEHPGVVKVHIHHGVVGEETLAGLWPGHALTPGPAVVVEVQDNGAGMDASTLGRIFDPFYTTKFAGRGMGLTAVLGILKSHGAGLAVQSQRERGTTFRLFLPEAEAPPPEEPAEVSAPEAGGSGALVLVADDEPELREFVREALRSQGYRVLLAWDGLEAVEVFSARREEVALVILDLTMPRMGGRDALLRIRALDPTVPVVLSSGYTEQDLVEGEATAFLHKPYRLAELLQTVARTSRG